MASVSSIAFKTLSSLGSQSSTPIRFIQAVQSSLSMVPENAVSMKVLVTSETLQLIDGSSSAKVSIFSGGFCCKAVTELVAAISALSSSVTAG